MSLPDLEYNTHQMHHLLAVYLQGLKDLGGNPKEQNLLVVLTKGDLLAPKLEKHSEIWNYLVNGDTKNLQYANLNSQLAEMKKISKSLKLFIRDDIGAIDFVNLGEKHFRAVDFCIISALGAAPKGDQLDISVTPKRIFDPILWVMNNSTGWFAFFFRLKVSLSNLIKKAQTSTKKETQAPSPSVEKKPINYRNIAKYGAGALILALVILFLYYPSVFPALSLPAFNLAQTPATTTPAIAVNAKNLDTRSYGDYLAAGQTNAYYFDIAENGENIQMIKVFAQAKSGNIITAAVGLNYAPSIENDKYDYLSSTSTTSDYAVIQINNPMPGRYYVIVKGVAGSGDTKVSRSFY
jgi:hypothetical protein